MKKRTNLVLAGALIAGVGAAAFATLSFRAQEAAALSDPRQEPPIVRLATAAQVTGSERSFTGIIAARVQSNLGFRVPGKIVERLVDVGQQVKAGQPLMRIDETDLRLALTAKRNAVAAARAVFVQAGADEKRYASLLNGGLATPQRYEQAKAALDTAEAQLAAAEADAKVAENEATYAILVADADGTVVATLGEPGQVVVRGTDCGSACPRRPARGGGRASRNDPAGDRLGRRSQRLWQRRAARNGAPSADFGLRRCPDPHL